MNDEQLLRYSRQILLPEVGVEGQQRLLEARVLVVGLGGLGSPVAMYLAAAGVGHLVLADFDHVDLSNLQRQIIHTTAEVGRAKVDSARARLAALNPDVRIDTLPVVLEGEQLAREVAAADAVVDATDNFAIRFALNAACVAHGTPLISGAAIRMEGQVAVFDPRHDGPCYRCLYKEGEELGETCSQTGVLAPVVGMIGSVQATETLKVLMGVGEPLRGRLLMLDAYRMEWRSLRLPRDPHCPVCASPGTRPQAGAASPTG
ncbi:molybdopterin-synthase adenylyltransferase MoeB [Ectothiorhodospiraceae bacterium 2226]|nr:molybdopterin-synthase adenylyltransferase MoeB [Ectothiorhodospiraceae bacterium 2226]